MRKLLILVSCLSMMLSLFACSQSGGSSFPDSSEEPDYDAIAAEQREVLLGMPTRMELPVWADDPNGYNADVVWLVVNPQPGVEMMDFRDIEEFGEFNYIVAWMDTRSETFYVNAIIMEEGAEQIAGAKVQMAVKCDPNPSEMLYLQLEEVEGKTAGVSEQRLFEIAAKLKKIVELEYEEAVYGYKDWAVKRFSPAGVYVQAEEGLEEQYWPKLELFDDGTFRLTINMLQGMDTIEGRFVEDEFHIQLLVGVNHEYQDAFAVQDIVFRIVSADELVYEQYASRAFKPGINMGNTMDGGVFTRAAVE